MHQLSESDFKAEYDEAYDAMLDTMINFRQRLVDGKVVYGNLRFLFLQMASQHYVRMQTSKAKVVSTDQFEEPEEELISISEDQLKTLETAWNKLGDACRIVENEFLRWSEIKRHRHPT